MRQTIHGFGAEFDPETSEMLLNNFYVDDLLKSVEDEDRGRIL